MKNKELLINVSLVTFALWCFKKGEAESRNPYRRLHWVSRLGTTIIFDQYVTPLTPVITVKWEGGYFDRRQEVVLTNVRTLPAFKQKPNDINGWVW